MATENELNLVTDPYLFLICGPLGAKASNQLENNPVTYQKENYLYLFTQAPTNICPLPPRCQPHGPSGGHVTAGARGRLTPLRTAAVSRVGGRTRGKRVPARPRPPPGGVQYKPWEGVEPWESSPEVRPHACDSCVASARPDRSAVWLHPRAGRILHVLPGRCRGSLSAPEAASSWGLGQQGWEGGQLQALPPGPTPREGLAGSATPHSPGVPVARSATWPRPVSRTRRPKSQERRSLSLPPKLNWGDSRWFRRPTAPRSHVTWILAKGQLSLRMIQVKSP